MNQLLKLKYILILLVLTFFAVKPLLHTGLPPTHDGEYHVIRMYEFDKAIRDGDLYPRWAPDLNNGYGVPLFNYVYPMPNYMGELFHIFGTSFIDAFKLNLLVATVIGVLFFYLWTRLFFGNAASLTSAIFYAFAPYRFVDIYVRGSVGEVWALAFFPAYLWSVTKLFKEDGRQKKIIYIVLSALFLAATIFSHNILALMCFLFGISYAGFLVWRLKEKKLFIAHCSLLIVLALGLSAIFWLPALTEKEYVQGLQIYDVDANFPELFQLLIPSWGTGFSGGGLQDQMSFQIGVANLLAVFVGFGFLFKKIKKKPKLAKYSSSDPPAGGESRSSLSDSHKVLDSVALRSNNKRLLIFSLSWFALVFYLLLGVSKPVWHTIPLLDYFQFPWRFLSLMIIICALIAGIVIQMIQGRKKRIAVSVIFIALAISTTIAYTQPAYYHNRTDDHYISRSNFIHGTNSPGDVFNTKWMNNKLPLKKERIEVVDGPVPDGTGLSVKINQIKKTSTVHVFRIDSEKEVKMLANIAYFPGWTLYLDGKEYEMHPTKDGLMEFSLPQGKHMVELRLNDTMIRKVASGLSLVALLVCVGLVVFRNKIHRFVS